MAVEALDRSVNTQQPEDQLKSPDQPEMARPGIPVTMPKKRDVPEVVRPLTIRRRPAPDPFPVRVAPEVIPLKEPVPYRR